MAFVTGTVPTLTSAETGNGYRRLFRLFRRYATGCVSLGVPVRTGTGNGTISEIDSVVPSAPSETWTILFLTATTFSVTGTTSLGQTNGSTGTNYTSNSPAGRISFRITVGATPFIAGDSFTIVATTNTAVTGNNIWVVDQLGLTPSVTDPFATNLELVWHGIGSAGADLIYTGIRLDETPASQLYYWELVGCTGFTPFSTATGWRAQPGTSASYFTPFWEQDIQYWIAHSGRRSIIGARVSTSYHNLYMGFILPYASPAEYPYPLFVGGEQASALAYNATTLNGFHDPGQGQTNNGGALRQVNGVWRVARQGLDGAVITWPYDSTSEGRDWLLNLETTTSSYPVFPVTLINLDTSASSASDVMGYFDGVIAAPGFGLSSGDTMTVGADTYTMLQNVQRSGRADFWGIKNA